MEIIPAIIAKNIAEVEHKIRAVESYANWVQLDIMDGQFVPSRTWNDPYELNVSDFSLFFEAHLMVADPASQLERWIAAGVKRIIVHIEAVGAEKSHTKTDEVQHQLIDMAERTHLAGVQFGIALNPETPVRAASEFLPHCDLILLLAVNPGFGGQKFMEEVLPKIKELRKIVPRVKIEVDGGINPETGKKCAEAGADLLVSGSYIFNSGNIRKAIDELRIIDPKTD